MRKQAKESFLQLGTMFKKLKEKRGIDTIEKLCNFLILPKDCEFAILLSTYNDMNSEESVIEFPSLAPMKIVQKGRLDMACANPDHP
jgi:hypothetical protein